MEDCCRTGKMPGRLIPVPGQVRAGCGMGWIAGPERRREFEKFMGERGICWKISESCIYNHIGFGSAHLAGYVDGDARSTEKTKKKRDYERRERVYYEIR